MKMDAMLSGSNGYAYTPQDGWAIQQHQQHQHPHQQHQHPHQHPHQQQQQQQHQQHQLPHQQLAASAVSANTISSAFGSVRSAATAHHPHFTSMYAGWY